MGKLEDGTEVKIKITYKSRNTLNDFIYFLNILFRGIMNILGFVELLNRTRIISMFTYFT
jgi:hypothetical protein